jgi:hypothetical protein
MRKEYPLDIERAYRTNVSVSRSDPYDLPAFSLSNNFYSTYAFTSFTATLRIISGDSQAADLGCISTVITPDLGSTLSAVLTFLPFVILLIVGIATAFAGVFSPWGSTDTFRWTTNYGRDADLLRLVTPGFGDCLQYIQFVVLTGGLTLSYPGFYQPVVSQVSWSALMFNESLVSHGDGRQSLVDGIYFTNGTYGLEKLSQLVGMTEVEDIWAGMAVWLCVLVASVVVLIQIGFALRWFHRLLSNTPEEDLRAKNFPFSVGNIVRIVFNYFLLPIVVLSMFQLVVAGRSPIYTVALAAVLLLLLIVFAIWLLYLIASTRPRSFLFDDLPTVLLYGALYNTYSDNAAPFALIPVLLTFVRGVAIGAVQPSGIAQLVLLAICEVITILTLHAFRPFHSPTSMNAYHTFFAAVRLASILLMVAFAPSLGVTEGPKGWIGYVILLMHAIVMVFGFLLNAIQTIVEVGARMAGAGGDESGATRGGLVRVFGMRQLSRRMPRREAAASRASQLSSAAMLDTEADRKSALYDPRLRSQSVGSNGVLLHRHSMGLDSFSVAPSGPLHNHQSSSGSVYTPTTPGEATPFSFLGGRSRGPPLGIMTGEPSDPYYRPPRPRRPTVDAYSPAVRSRGSWADDGWGARRWSQPDTSTPTEGPGDLFEGPSVSARGSPKLAHIQHDQAVDARRSKTDYTTREVDYYYNIRGPALNAGQPGRRLGTGPADPTGPVASATGWFKGLFKGKTKEKGKGFEVVRSSRMPPGMKARNVAGEDTPPEGIPVATGAIRNGPIDSDDDEVGDIHPVSPQTHHREGTVSDGDVSPLSSDASDDEGHDGFDSVRVSDLPPSLPGIDIGDGIELPSRNTSRSSNNPTRKPTVPRKSSRRQSRGTSMTQAELGHVVNNEHSRSNSIELASTDLYDPPPGHRQNLSVDSARLPFDRSNSTARVSTTSATSSAGMESDLGRGGALGRYSIDTRGDRPTSVGYVHQHSPKTVTASGHDFLGSSAEVVDERSL